MKKFKKRVNSVRARLQGLKSRKNGALQFVPTPEGYYDFTKNAYIYNYVDHLGNVRISYTKSSAGVLEILEEGNYYPFGLRHEGYNSVATSTPSYKYKYNGKELQETGMYDYGARFYMPDIGRFGTIDPRSQYTHEAYSYVWNNPIYFTDPTGMEGELAICPTCPKTPEFQPYIDDPNHTYVYVPETNTAEKEVQIQEVLLTGKAKSSNFGPGSLALMALMVSQADSPAPGPADVIAAGMLIGAGVWWLSNQFTQPSYTTIADPGIGYRNLNAESEVEEDTDVNGITVPDENKIPRDSLNPPTKPGNAPTFKKDGKSVEIHHEDQNANGPFKEMHPNDHRGKGNYNKNHPKGNKPLTKQERIRFNNARQKYWKKEYPNVK